MQWLDEARKLKAGVNDEDFEDSVSGYTAVSVLYIDDLLKQKYSPDPTFTGQNIAENNAFLYSGIKLFDYRIGNAAFT